MLKNIFTSKKEVLSISQIIYFCEELSLILGTGIPLLEGLYILKDNSIHTKDKELYTSVISKLEDGNSFTNSLSSINLFPSYMINMINIGEVSGNLTKVFTSLTIYYKKEQDLRNNIRNSIIYPCSILLMMFIVINTIIFYVIPVFETVYKQLGNTNSNIIHTLLNISIYIRSNINIILIFIFVLILLIVILNITNTGKKIKNYIFNILISNNKLYIKISISRLINGMSLLLSSGINIDKTLELIEPLVNNNDIKNNINKVRIDINNGNDLATAFEQNNILDNIYSKMLSIGVKTGNTENVINNISEYYTKEVEKDITKLISIIEPTLIGILAIIVGGILLTIMFPLINIIGQIS